MPYKVPFTTIHANGTQALLLAAFSDAKRHLNDGAGFTMKVTLRSGATFEGAPTVTSAKEIGYVFAFENGAFVLSQEISAIEVSEA